GWPSTPEIPFSVARKRALGTGDMAAIARAGAAECLRSGITTVGDASFSGAAATACADLGLRAVVYIEVFGAGTEHIQSRFEVHRDRIQAALSDRVRLGISPHSVYSASLELWTASAGLGLPMMTHFAESEAEVEWVQHRTGPFAGVLQAQPANSIRLLAGHGLLGPALVAAHAVHLDPEERDLL